MRDVFYDIGKLSLEKKEELYREAKELSHRTFIDEKDLHYKRIPSKTTFEEMMQKMTKKCHHVFIERNITFGGEEPYLETGFCTMAEELPGDWFLFINLSREHLQHFVDKYSLKPL